MVLREKRIQFIVISRYVQSGLHYSGEGILNLLVVTWSEEKEGVASRIGFTNIAESGWVKAREGWRRIILE